MKNVLINGESILLINEAINDIIKGNKNITSFDFNIDSMEETNTIIGVGANAISKRVYNIEHTIKRQPNVKFIEDYVDRIDEIIEKKEEFFK